MPVRRILLVLSLAASACTLAGCIVAAVGAGAGTIAYMKGDLESVEPEGLDSVHAAAKKAVEQLEMNLVTDNKDALSATLVARDAGDNKVTIKLSATAEGATKISIRIGTFGSETKSRLIYEQIKENLKK